MYVLKNESIYKIYCVVNKGNDTSRIVALGTQPQTSNEFQTLHKMDDKNMFYLAIIFLSTIQNICQRLQYNKKKIKWWPSRKNSEKGKN